MSSGTEEREHREVWGKVLWLGERERGIRYKNLKPGDQLEPGQKLATELSKAGHILVTSQYAVSMLYT